MTTHHWPFRSGLALGALPTAVPCARLHAKHVLWEWRLDHLAKTAELLVSELVTNAIHASARLNGPPVRLWLFSDNRRVLIEVWDGDTRPPAPTPLTEDGMPALGEEGGRGLFLVATLSQRWDWFRTQEPAGKVVWAELA